MTSSVGSSSTISTDARPAGVVNTAAYDPEMMHQVNLSDPEELEAHLQVMDVRQRLRKRRRRGIQCFSVCFIIVVAALLSGIGVSTKKGKENADEQKLKQKGGDLLASTSSDAKLPEPPADLASKCSLTTLNTAEGVAVCESACEKAECCDVPDGYALSCIVANKVVCAEYQRYCDILKNLPSAGFVPPEGFVPPLQNDTSPVSDEALKVEIDAECVDVGADILPGSSCMDLCRQGFCCFDESSSCDVNCQTYLNCRAAYTASKNIPAPAPTPMTLRDEINQLCSDYVEAINPPGENTCEQKCSTSFCCFNHYCVPPADIDCLEYSGCYVLYADVDTVDDDENESSTPTLADEIHAACNNAGSINDAASNTECTTLCAPGACCFFNNLECVDVKCETYAECNIVFPEKVAVTKEEVEDACKNHNDNGSGASLCEQVCTLHVMQCCFHENGACDNPLQNDGSVFCDAYQACDVLGTKADSLRESHKAELDSACSGIATRSECIKLCTPAICCFASTLDDECANGKISLLVGVFKEVSYFRSLITILFSFLFFKNSRS